MAFRLSSKQVCFVIPVFNCCPPFFKFVISILFPLRNLCCCVLVWTRVNCFLSFSLDEWAPFLNQTTRHWPSPCMVDFCIFHHLFLLAFFPTFLFIIILFSISIYFLLFIFFISFAFWLVLNISVVKFETKVEILCANIRARFWKLKIIVLFIGEVSQFNIFIEHLEIKNRSSKSMDVMLMVGWSLKVIVSSAWVSFKIENIW